MKKISEVLVALVPYLTLCAGLYQLTYWSKFDINGLEFISISAIVKSSIYPIIVTFIFAILGMILGESIFRFDDKMPSGAGRKTKFGKFLNKKMTLSIIIILWCAALYFIFNHGTVYRWIIWAFLFASVPTVTLDRLGLWKDDFNNNGMRLWAIRILVLLPSFSFSAAKINSELIYDNYKFEFVIGENITQYVKDFPVNESDTLKYLGKSDNYIHLISMDNSQKYIVRKDKLDYLEFKDFVPTAHKKDTLFHSNQ